MPTFLSNDHNDICIIDEGEQGQLGRVTAIPYKTKEGHRVGIGMRIAHMGLHNEGRVRLFGQRPDEVAAEWVSDEHLNLNG
ncbi:MAG: hypothetical protein UV63_C0065G0004 [Microgenomates group bacterium GW2011_GWC1_43_11]|nr:MAG: hypothetical protein UV63_C0065G0004 [Microgenomates group bacterium GW2011_GWC1_43_11]HCM82911.1 hypothetical protein [Patescibacteria group bacterium]